MAARGGRLRAARAPGMRSSSPGMGGAHSAPNRLLPLSSAAGDQFTRLQPASDLPPALQPPPPLQQELTGLGSAQQRPQGAMEPAMFAPVAGTQTFVPHQTQGHV